MNELQSLADEAGNPNAFRSDLAGFTYPEAEVDQTGLNWAPDITKDGIKLRFTGGTLSVRIHTTVYLVDTLNSCEKRYWQEHEEHHAQDYLKLAKRLAAALETDLVLKDLFDPKNTPSGRLAEAFKQQVHDAVRNVFLNLTEEAATNLDTAAEYARARKAIKQCLGPGQPTRGGPAVGRPTVNNSERQRP